MALLALVGWRDASGYDTRWGVAAWALDLQKEPVTAAAPV